MKNSIKYEECAIHPGNSLANCPMCEFEKFNAEEIIKKGMKVKVEHDHKCERIATAPSMSEGREIWIGKLLEVIPEWPDEEYCLHWKTPIKEVTFLLNRADFRNLEILCRCVLKYPTNDDWLKTMVALAKNIKPTNKK